MLKPRYKDVTNISRFPKISYLDAAKGDHNQTIINLIVGNSQRYIYYFEISCEKYNVP